MALEMKKQLRIAHVVVGNPTGALGGAERFFVGLAEALERDGLRVEQIVVPADESTFEKVLESRRRVEKLNLSEFDGVLSNKTPAFIAKHPNHVVYLMHTMRVFYDLYNFEFPHKWPELESQRKTIIEGDTEAFRRAKKIFSQSYEVDRRLRHWNGLGSEVLHPGVELTGQANIASEPFILLPGRLHRWKRVDLAVQAFKHVRSPMKLVVTGDGEDRESIETLARSFPNVELRGRVSDEELRMLYSTCRAVMFPPIREDYGYITLEAFLAEKPVITCTDSGEPTFFVRDGHTGLVSQPHPLDLAAAIDFAYTHRAEMEAMGVNGRRIAEKITWEPVAQRLNEALTV